MNIIKDNIKAWLKRTGRSRDWLGQQLGVSKKTVDNWLSVQEIPDGKLRLIERLMADDVAEDARQKQLSEPTNQVFSVEVDLMRFRRYNAAATAEGLLLEEWTIKTLDSTVERISATVGIRASITSAAPVNSSPDSLTDATRLNEDPTPYLTKPSATHHRMVEDAEREPDSVE